MLSAVTSMPPLTIHPMPLASVIFGAGLFAWGLLACAVPVLIHLALRQKPRRQVFPAMRFLLQSHHASTRAHRIRNLLLLLCRMTVILLLVLTLLKTGCTADDRAVTRKWSGDSTEPVSAVICLDDSASMGYRFQGQTRLDLAVTRAKELLEDPSRFPPGSQVAIATGSPFTEKHPWTTDLRGPRKQLDALHVGDHARSVGMILRRAYSLLPSAAHSRREIYLLTDLTRHSWPHSPPPPPPELTALHILDVGQEENRNTTLDWPTLPRRPLPAGLPVSLTAHVLNGDLPAAPELEIAVDGQPRHRQLVDPLPPRATAEIPLPLPPMSKGTHAVTLTLQPTDALTCDNQRFLTVTVGELPNTLLVSGQPTREVAALVASMIAPRTLEPARQRFALTSTTPDRLHQTELDDFAAVILADAAPLDSEAWDNLRGYVDSGGTVVIVPGPNMEAINDRPVGTLWGEALFTTEECTEPVTLAASKLTHPFLRPFADPAIDSINSRRVFRRLRLDELPADSRTVAPFSDGRPALIERGLGEGRVILLAFSPARDWGQFGARAAPMIVLLHTMLTEVAPPPPDTASLKAGRATPRRIPRSPGATLLFRHSLHGRPEPLLTDADPARDSGLVHLPAGRAGHYQVLSDETGKSATSLLQYSVNVAEAESDPDRLDPAEIEAMFPTGLATVADSVESLSRIERQSPSLTDLAVPLALALLLMLLLETLFANRFYGLKFTSSPRT